MDLPPRRQTCQRQCWHTPYLHCHLSAKPLMKVEKTRKRRELKPEKGLHTQTYNIYININMYTYTYTNTYFRHLNRLPIPDTCTHIYTLYPCLYLRTICIYSIYRERCTYIYIYAYTAYTQIYTYTYSIIAVSAILLLLLLSL